MDVTWTRSANSGGGRGGKPPPGQQRGGGNSCCHLHSLFLMSFSSLRMREDSCSGVGADREMEAAFSTPEGGAGSLWRNKSSMLLCSLRLRPCRGKTTRGTVRNREESGLNRVYRLEHRQKWRRRLGSPYTPSW